MDLFIANTAMGGWKCHRTRKKTSAWSGHGWVRRCGISDARTEASEPNRWIGVHQSHMSFREFAPSCVKFGIAKVARCVHWQLSGAIEGVNGGLGGGEDVVEGVAGTGLPCSVDKTALLKTLSRGCRFSPLKQHTRIVSWEMTV